MNDLKLMALLVFGTIQFMFLLLGVSSSSSSYGKLETCEYTRNWHYIVPLRSVGCHLGKWLIRRVE